jgi:uncharacterized protein (DUF362 family)
MIPATAGLIHSACAAPDEVKAYDGPKGVVAIMKAATYQADLVDILTRGAQLCGLNVRGKRVLLKPNLVEFDSNTCINTSPVLVAAALETFRKLGAASVRIGEGPGHRRDTHYLAEAAGFYEAVKGFEDQFTDLNLDDVSERAGFLEGGRMYFPNTVLGADLIVSMPKMKTHHWAGVTLSMKNLFGLVPGSVYGWPKNPLHYAGIPNSIVQLNRMFRNTFAIVDGIVGMEGNGPIQGSPRQCGVVVMGNNVASVDASCCRVMGIEPGEVEYLKRGRDVGHIEEAQIEQRGEVIDGVRTEFGLWEGFRHLRRVSKMGAETISEFA